MSDTKTCTKCGETRLAHETRTTCVGEPIGSRVLHHSIVTTKENPMTRMLYPINDATEVLGIGRSTLYELIASGEIHTLKIGRRTLISEDELRRYIRTLEGAPSQVSVSRRDRVESERCAEVGTYSCACR